MRCADLGEPHFGCDAFGSAFMPCVTVTVHENNRGATQTRFELHPQIHTQTVFVQGLDDFAKSTYPFVRLHHGTVQQLTLKEIFGY